MWMRQRQAAALQPWQDDEGFDDDDDDDDFDEETGDAMPVMGSRYND